MTRDNVVPVVQLHRVTKVYHAGQNRTTAAHRIWFHGPASTLHLLLGPSGSGKTTLLALMAGFLRPTTGRVLLFGRDIAHCSEEERQRMRAGKIGFVFQSFRLISPLTVGQNVEQVLRFGRVPRGERLKRVRQTLQDLSIEHLSERFPETLSQGEKQRVAIARAIVHEPSLVLADEPTANLESRQGAEVIELLQEYARNKGACVVVASHDLRLEPRADSVYWIEDGTLRAVGSHQRKKQTRLTMVEGQSAIVQCFQQNRKPRVQRGS